MFWALVAIFVAFVEMFAVLSAVCCELPPPEMLAISLVFVVMFPVFVAMFVAFVLDCAVVEFSSARMAA